MYLTVTFLASFSGFELDVSLLEGDMVTWVSGSSTQGSGVASISSHLHAQAEKQTYSSSGGQRKKIGILNSSL